jgi:type IV pilus assembly protein PilV
MHPPGTSSRAARRAMARKHQSGIALIEVLVALLIFMLGVLGLVGLQTSMTRAQTEAKVRADAVNLANDLIGRMWTDLNNLSAYNASGCASQTRCREWQDKVAAALPVGQGAVAFDATSGNVTVTISWTTPSGESHKYVTSTTVSKAST